MESLNRTRYVAKALGESPYIDESFLVTVALSFRLDKTSGPGWVAVGDAASSYDPISSQGIYKAMTDGIEAGKAIARILSNESSTYEAYEASISARYEDYLKNRNFFYANENRWPESHFWSRRKNRQ